MKLEVHDATVVANEEEDGVQKGRIKVACLGLLGDEDTAMPMWIPPRFDWGWFSVPDVGEIVQIEVNVDSDTDEFLGQSSIDNLDVHYRGKRSYTSESPEEGAVTRIIHEDFLVNYPKRRGFATPNGHVIFFDDTDGSQKVELTWVKDDDVSKLSFNEDGTVKLSILGGKHHIHLQENNVQIQLDEGTNVSLANKDSDATMTVGDGAVSVTIAETMKTLWDAMVTTFANHTHIDAMGGTGPVNSGPMDPWDAQINSAKVKIPDN